MAIGLFLIWLILNGRVTWEVVLVGAAVSAAIYALALRFTEYSWALDRRVMRAALLLPAYLLVLIWSIVKSSLTVARVILNRRIPLQKTLTTVEIDLRTDMARMVLANSITLTPGTITVQVEGRRFTVHCLSRELLNGIESGAFVRLLRRMEG